MLSNLSTLSLEDVSSIQELLGYEVIEGFLFGRQHFHSLKLYLSLPFSSFYLINLGLEGLLSIYVLYLLMYVFHRLYRTILTLNFSISQSQKHPSSALPRYFLITITTIMLLDSMVVVASDLVYNPFVVQLVQDPDSSISAANNWSIAMIVCTRLSVRNSFFLLTN
jgi:hypothetical protein